MRTVKQSRAKDNKKCRRGLRLRGYDYSRAGAYFVTLCAADRRRLFGEIVDDQMVDNPYAKLGRRCWEDLPNHYAHVTLDASVIMPNHVHGIIVLSGYDANDAPGRHGLAEIMRALKTYSARRGYYEPIVRDENALARIREYIVANPRN